MLSEYAERMETGLHIVILAIPFRECREQVLSEHTERVETWLHDDTEFSWEISHPRNRGGNDYSNNNNNNITF